MIFECDMQVSLTAGGKSPMRDSAFACLAARRDRLNKLLITGAAAGDCFELFANGDVREIGPCGGRYQQRVMIIGGGAAVQKPQCRRDATAERLLHRVQPGRAIGGKALDGS